jgi:hypothetical protein
MRGLLTPSMATALTQRKGLQGVALQGETAEELAAYLTSFALKHSFQVAGRAFEAAVSATLVGHEDWVHAVAWAPAAARSARGGAGGPRALLSVAMDRTAMLWALDAGGSIWMCEEAVGDAGARAAAAAAAAPPRHSALRVCPAWVSRGDRRSRQ